MNPKNQECLLCGKSFKGRIDKKFCDDYCRNSYNNRKNSTQNNYIRNINNMLRRNRNILASLLPEQEKSLKISRTLLLASGFNFQYFTNQYPTQEGQMYFFIYEYGYFNLNDDWVLLVKRKVE